MVRIPLKAPFKGSKAKGVGFRLPGLGALQGVRRGLQV